MFGWKVVIVLATCLSWSHCKMDKYCSLCKDHTLCQFQGIGEDCTDVGEGGVSKKEKSEIINIHNWLRSIVASGSETRGAGKGQPKAANMRQMVWDTELEKVAQRWADQCRFQHDTCRNVARWNVGQNIYWKWKYPTHTANWSEAIISWYDEVSSHNPKDVKNYRFVPATGHYTQLVWHNTYAVGCGRRDYGLNKLYVCNYGPAGNWLNEPMYEIGEPCSKCPSGTSCNQFLCTAVSPKPKSAPAKSQGRKVGKISTSKSDRAAPADQSNVTESQKPNLNCTHLTVLELTKKKEEDEERKEKEEEEEEEEEKDDQEDTEEPFDESEIDEDVMKEIENIKRTIVKLVKRVIKKYKQ